MGYPVAPSDTCVLRGVSLRLCTFSANVPPPVSVAPVDASDASAIESWLEAVERWPRQCLDDAAIDPLASAYVILIPLTDLKRGMGIATAEEAALCRTNAAGQILHIEPSEIGGDVPPVGDREALFEPDAIYSCFWTYEMPIAVAVWSELTSSDSVMAVSEVQRAHRFFEFTLRETRSSEETYQSYVKSIWGKWLNVYGTPMPSDLASWRRMNLLLHNVGDALSGYFTGPDLQEIMKAKDAGKLDRKAKYLFARVPTFQALSLFEVLHGTALIKRLVSFKEYAVFSQATDVAESAVADPPRRSPSIDAKIYSAEGESSGIGTSTQWAKWREAQREYHEYTFKCAKAKIDRGDFEDSIRMGSRGEWREAATKILSKGILHPSLPLPDVQRKPVDKEVYLAYYDFYRFGLDNHENTGWRMRVLGTQKAFEDELRRFTDTLSGFLDKHIRYEDFLRDLGARTLGKRTQIHYHFLTRMLFVVYPWWERFDPTKEMGKLGPYLDWTGTGADKAGELFGKFFEKRGADLARAMAAKTATVGEAMEKFERLFKRMETFNKTLKGKTVVKQFGKNHVLHIDFKTYVVSVIEGGSTAPAAVGRGEKVGEFLFSVETTKTVPKKVKRKTIRGDIKSVKADRAIGPIMDPLPGEPKWPAFMAAFGDGISLVLSFASRAEDLKTKSNIEVYGKIAMNVFQSADSASSAFATIAKGPWGDRLKMVSKVAKPIGLTLEIAFNAYEGGCIVFEEKGELMKAYLDGSTAEVWLVGAKGTILLASATVGAVAVGGGLVGVSAATTAAAATAAVSSALATAGISLAIAGLAVVAIDIVLYILRGDDAMAPLRDALESALEKEFGPGYVGKSGKDPNDSRTTDAMVELHAHTRELLKLLAPPA
jgi:hypothetical protein